MTGIGGVCAIKQGQKIGRFLRLRRCNGGWVIRREEGI